MTSQHSDPSLHRQANHGSMVHASNIEAPDEQTLLEPRQDRASIGWLAIAGAGVAVAALLADAALRDGSPRNRPPRAARLAAWGAAMLASSVLVDSAMEHYRGSYQKRAMTVAPPAAAVTVAAAVATALSPRFLRLKSAIFSFAVLTGLAGTGFHARNIVRRTGGLSLNNVFYRAPFGAPAALALAGAGGLGAAVVQRASARYAASAPASAASPLGTYGAARPDRTTIGRAMGFLTATGLFGLTAEVGLLHFRGAFQNPFMWAPVLCLPATGAALLAKSVETRLADPAINRWAGVGLGTTAFLAIAGTGLHAWGVGRSMGGFRNWTQNLFAGPPIAAPPSLAGIAFLGFAALDLLRPYPDES